MYSPGVTFQSICLPTTSLLTVVCRGLPLLGIRGGAGPLQVCTQNFITSWTCSFINSYTHITKTIISFLRHQGVRAYVCLCPPGSVTGICPCRVKVCRAWLVTAPRGQAVPRKATLSSLQLQLTA